MIRFSILLPLELEVEAVASMLGAVCFPSSANADAAQYMVVRMRVITGAIICVPTVFNKGFLS